MKQDPLSFSTRKLNSKCFEDINVIAEIMKLLGKDGKNASGPWNRYGTLYKNPKTQGKKSKNRWNCINIICIAKKTTKRLPAD